MEAPVNRSLSVPLEATVAEKTRFGDGLVRAIRSSSILSAVAGPLAASYLRSIDPIATFAQKALSRVGLCRLARDTWEFRVVWRQGFEDKICTLARDRTLEGIDVVLGFYVDMGYALPSDPKETLYSRLMDALSKDTALVAEMADLQKLPISRQALQRRLLALDAGVERHLAALAHDIVMGHFACVVHGGVE